MMAPPQKSAQKDQKRALFGPWLQGSGTILKNAQKLRIGGPGAAHVEVLEGEVRALHIVEPNPSPQGQALNRSIRNRAAKPRVLQQLRAREGLPTLQANHIPIHRFHGQEGALLNLATGPDQSQPRPDSHGLWRICRHGTASLVLHQQGLGRREPAILPFIDLQPLGMGDDQAHVGLPAPREAPPGLPHRFGQWDLVRAASTRQPSQELEDLLVEAPALREFVAPATGQIVQQLAVLQLLADLRAREAIQDGGQLPEVAEQQEANLLVHAQTCNVSPQRGI